MCEIEIGNFQTWAPCGSIKNELINILTQINHTYYSLKLHNF